MNTRIGYEDMDRLLTYPDANNLSVSRQAIRERLRHAHHPRFRTTKHASKGRQALRRAQTADHFDQNQPKTSLSSEVDCTLGQGRRRTIHDHADCSTSPHFRAANRPRTPPTAATLPRYAAKHLPPQSATIPQYRMQFPHTSFNCGQVLWSGVIVLCPSGWVMR